MLVKSKTSAHSSHQGVCLSCGAGNIGKRRYCSIRCRQQLRQKLNTRSGLLQALNTRYATFYFTDTLIVLDGSARHPGSIPGYKVRAARPCQTGGRFRRHEQPAGGCLAGRGKKDGQNYLASMGRVLEMAERLAMAEGLKRPRWVKVPGVKPESILLLDMAKADLASREPHKIIKNAYRRQVKIHHPDAGGTAAAFRRIHAAYQDLAELGRTSHLHPPPRFSRQMVL